MVFGNTIHHDYNLDDGYYIDLIPKENDSFQGVFLVFNKRFFKNDYRPVPAFHLALESYVFGLSPTVFHTFNLVFYALLGMLLFYLFRALKIFPKEWMIFLLVVFFLIHPSHSNVVASIKNRDVILGMLYGLSGVFCLIKFHDVKNYGYLVLGIVLFYAAILCKFDGFLFIGAGAATLYFFREIKLKTIAIIASVLLVIVIGLYFINTSIILEDPINIAVTDEFENPLINDQGSIENLFINIGLSTVYHKFMVVPTGYHYYFGYNHIAIPKVSSPLVIITALLYLIIALLFMNAIINKKKNALLYGVLFYALFLAPFIRQLDSIAGLVAVRYSFNASLGFAIIVLSIFMYGYNSKKIIIRQSSVLVLAFIFISSTYFTIDRNKDWKNKETLFSHDLKYLKDSYMANRMGGAYYRFLDENLQNNDRLSKVYISKSLKHLNIAKSIYNKEPVLWQQFGLLNWKKENYKQAFLNFRNALSLDSTNTISWNYYGNFSEFVNDFQRAEEAYKQIVKLEPTNPLGYKNLTFTLLNQQKIEEAIELNNALLSNKKLSKNGYENLGHISIGIMDTVAAINYFNKAFEKGLDNDALKNEISKLSQ